MVEGFYAGTRQWRIASCEAARIGTPEITVEQARRLLASIEPASVVDYRDRALIAVLIYTAARAGAVGKLRLRDFVEDGSQFVLRFAEKGGKARSIPVRHDLQCHMQDFLVVAGLSEEPKDSPLFCATTRRTNGLSALAMNGVDVCRMVKRRLKATGRDFAAERLLRQ
jgi:integrase